MPNSDGDSNQFLITDGNGSLSWSYSYILQPVRVASTSFGTLSSDFANGQTVDGITLSTNDRILIKDQSTASENGIYIVTSGAPTRSSDFDSATDAVNGKIVFVQDGTTNGNTGWQFTSSGSITVGSSNLSFEKFTSLGGGGGGGGGGGVTISGTQENGIATLSSTASTIDIESNFTFETLSSTNFNSSFYTSTPSGYKVCKKRIGDTYLTTISLPLNQVNMNVGMNEQYAGQGTSGSSDPYFHTVSSSSNEYNQIYKVEAICVQKCSSSNLTSIGITMHLSSDENSSEQTPAVLNNVVDYSNRRYDISLNNELMSSSESRFSGSSYTNSDFKFYLHTSGSGSGSETASGGKLIVNIYSADYS